MKEESQTNYSVEGNKSLPLSERVSERGIWDGSRFVIQYLSEYSRFEAMGSEASR